MSRTDKDVPYRVHVDRIGTEEHDHSRGDCDLEEWIPEPGWRRRTRCRREIDWRYSRVLTLFSRRKLQGWFAREIADRDNARVRDAGRDIIKLHAAGEDIAGEEIPSFQHRHSAEWEVW